MKKERLDVLLVEQGFFATRENAKRHIMAGIVLVNDRPVDKPGTRIDTEAHIRIKGEVMPYVGRGGYKLEKALQCFNIDLHGAVMADIGASTGGFTDCALQNGAARVYAIDVGYNQLDWKLRNHPQVINMEKTNMKNVTPEDLGEPADFISVDVSFISLLKILPAARAILKPEGSMVTLIKPQFEAGREKVGKGGIIRDAADHKEILASVLDGITKLGFSICGLTYSPIKGAAGNIEFLAWLKKDDAAEPPERGKIEQAVTEAHQNLGG